MFEIFVPDEHDSMSGITLDGTAYLLRFTYNSTADYWSIGLYDENENGIIPMTRIVPYFDLFGIYTYDGLPEGTLFCDSREEYIRENAFRDGTAHMIYLEKGDSL